VSVECRSGLVELIADVIGLVDVRLARPCRLRTLECVQLFNQEIYKNVPTYVITHNTSMSLMDRRTDRRRDDLPWQYRALSSTAQ